MTKEEIRADKAKEVAESLSRAGITPEVAQEILKELDEAEREGKDNIHIRVINIKTSKKKTSDDSQEEAAKEELRKAQDETKPEPAPEKKPEAGECTLDTLVAANVRFAKAAKDMTNEYFHLSRMAADLLQENAELRGRLEKK